MTDQRSRSEDVIINAPMSYAGAAQRAFRLRRKITTPVLGTVVALLVTLLWWTAVTGWYLLFGILVFPYRMLRRGARKRKAEGGGATPSGDARRDGGEAGAGCRAGRCC